MHQPGGININFGNQGVNGFHGPRCGRGGGPRGQMMRMMQMMLQIMSRMMGGPQQGCGCCPNSRPNFGSGLPFQQQGGGLNFQMGASIRGFLG